VLLDRNVNLITDLSKLERWLGMWKSLVQNCITISCCSFSRVEWVCRILMYMSSTELWLRFYHRFCFSAITKISQKKGK
jgi:hypothetical protein